LSRAYRHLPVFEVDEWEPGIINHSNLSMHVSRYGALFTDKQSKRELLDRLSINYWWRMIKKGKRI
jgi:hypothetical protein